MGRHKETEFQVRERFDKKYSSKGGLVVLYGMIKNGYSLERVGKYFGVSKQAIDQLLDKITVHPKATNKLSSITKKIISHSPRLLHKFNHYVYKENNVSTGRIAEIILQSNLKEAIYNGSWSPCDFYFKGINIDAKTSLKKWKFNKNYPGYYRFNVSNIQKDIVDFFFVYTPVKCYLIPSWFLSGKSNVYITKKFEKFEVTPEFIKDKLFLMECFRKRFEPNHPIPEGWRKSSPPQGDVAGGLRTPGAA